MVKNPFGNRNPVKHPMAFYDRRDDAVRIMRQISSQSCSIYAEPRIGRTSFLRYLAHPEGARKLDEIREHLYQPDDYLFILVELQALPSRNTLDFWRYLFDQLSAETKKMGRESEEMCTYHQECRTSRNEYEIQFGFERYLKAVTGLVVFLFDDFEILINDFAVSETTAATQKLRALAQSIELQDKLKYIIMSADPLQQLFAKRGLDTISSPFFNILLNVDVLGLLDDEGAHQLIQEPLHELGAKGPEFTAEEIEFILQVAGRHPDLIKVACNYLYNAKLQEKPKVNTALVQQTLEEDPHVRWLLERLWERAKEADEDEGMALCKTLSLIAKGEEPKALRTLPELERRGLVDTSTAKPQIFSSLFRNFIRQREGQAMLLSSPPVLQSLESKPAERSVRLNGNTIKLTPLEFKLFEYLVKNAGRTCSRDELHRTIWRDNPPTSRDGLEQLIKRLREKIETDPKQPQHLLAVRGQGYLLRTSVETVVNA